MIDVLVPLAARLSTGALFLAAAAHKASQPSRFRRTLVGYRVFGPAAGGLAIVTPCVEFAVGAAALAPSRALFAPALACAALLLVAYAGLLWTSIRAGRRSIDCGCLSFGARGRELTPAMAVRNLAFAGVALAGLLATVERPLGWLDALQLAPALVSAALLYGAIELASALPSRSTT
ncbi:MAG TPA: MauE/DoxX family redox-associated membrane protein [Phenylobacterium sp.]|uniref:MauE/DoxX family redox-associated membrane protein n=1 Tax=Phenylobacterium sp. TaxID=1871053 RepID=UPI002B4A9091|nr:MauE/DoxX family redox-associated membrane protein [Phenylobacterium sp.]HKR87128.1 MauE/DoxX family redox-associated membrane protein [Phenylobacterium sp.]